MEPIDPREVMATEAIAIEDFETLEEGDFIKCDGWSRPRVIVKEEMNGQGKYFFLADPDPRFVEKPRKVDGAQFQQKGSWVKYPKLSMLWKAYITGNETEASPSTPKSKGGGFKLI